MQIYRGILAVSRDSAVRAFAQSHIDTEQRHLDFFDHWLPAEHHSRLLPVWRAAGWILGATAALFGRYGVFLTIDAVESFVETHYQAQIDAMQGVPGLEALVEQLQNFCDDEVHHRDDARERRRRPSGMLARAWAATIGYGSVIGVAIARRV